MDHIVSIKEEEGGERGDREKGGISGIQFSVFLSLIVSIKKHGMLSPNFKVTRESQLNFSEKLSQRHIQKHYNFKHLNYIK